MFIRRLLLPQFQRNGKLHHRREHCVPGQGRQRTATLVIGIARNSGGRSRTLYPAQRRYHRVIGHRLVPESSPRKRGFLTLGFDGIPENDELL